ncbi:hypothetical protein N7509_009876 [Penicillium cosmopolitanum]|uniref:Uncharacterized protein n=1 Tax=Penicillium cosmopolitanum TaxID=1131564 RepID=A0A9X0B432_9EURO|nr:uncharacterized protein N7509_009876 [Penicillium cosmopolitanum]KAJ5387335.1 hypothetical protein N7509_009876 [Penicillium cosmopolitanum]
MICEEVELSMEGADSRTYEGNAELPIGQITLAAGVPNPVGNLFDPHANLSSTTRRVTVFKARTGKSSIFAVELKKVTTELFSKTLKLKEAGLTVDALRLAEVPIESPQEALEKPVDAEDLLLDDLDPKCYEDMEK